MGIDLSDLRRAVARHGPLTRVVIADIRGSSPREVGAAMLVWAGGQSGTIGGGTLEYEAAIAARAGRQGLFTHPLGPELGQCCGGTVKLFHEVWDAQKLAAVSGNLLCRPTALTEVEPPLSVARLKAQARGQGTAIAPQLVDGWMVEPIHEPARQLWIWGAGHVGRALVQVLHPLPDLAVTWVDTSRDRYPGELPEAVTILPTPHPAKLVPHAPQEAEHLILTYSHQLDLELCHQLLRHDFRFAGLIGSQTKWARFRSRLRALGHTSDQIQRITCPIGDPTLGKHPQAIAIGVGAMLLSAPVQNPVHNPAKSPSNQKDMTA